MRYCKVLVKNVQARWECGLPSIDLIEDHRGFRGTVYRLEEILNPLDEVVLECAFDDLVEEVGGQKFMDIRLWVFHHERLDHDVKNCWKPDAW